MSAMVSGALLHAGVDAGIEPVIVGDYTTIQQFVGGHFDCVRKEIDDEGTVIVGYVHDEGLLLGMETNWTASAMFGRELAGPCVIVSGTSPSGEYDGENYDLPTGFFGFLTTTFKEHVRQTLAESLILTAGVELMRQQNIIDDADLEDLDAAFASKDDDAVMDWFEKIGDRAMDSIVARESSKLEQEIQDFLGGL